MQFFISQLILWPVRPDNSIQTLTFVDDKVNIIHGRSRTGKSSIIAIIDYCLGASRCTIPVGQIRDKTAWFGLKVRIRDTWVLIARRTPERAIGSKECHISRLAAREAPLPDELTGTHTLAQFKEAFNKIARITNISLVADEDGSINSENPPSYRDLASFNLLPQHIVANPNVLFYKSDSYKHKEKLKRVFPYALGIVDADYLTATRERNRLQKQLDGLQKEELSRHRAYASWEADVRVIWEEAVKLGLLEAADGESLELRVGALKELNDGYLRGDLIERLRAPQYGYANEQLRLATLEEDAAQRNLDDLARELQDYERLSGRAKELAKAVDTEQAQVVSLDWLQRSLVHDSACVVCGSKTDHSHFVLDKLAGKLNDVARLSKALREGPIVDRQLEQLKRDLTDAEARLHAARLRRIELKPDEFSPLGSFGRIFVLLGRLQSLLMALATLEGRGDLPDRIRETERRIKILDDFINASGREEREKAVGRELTNLIEGYASNLKLEEKGRIALDEGELTLSFTRAVTNRKDYLWEIGSGANWMAYHLATFLALHEFFTKQERINGPVFSFLAIDQPSQVYFPSTFSGTNLLDQYREQATELRGKRDVDIEQTRLIFVALARGLQRSEFKYQTIVVEHADKSIWGEGKWGRYMHEVAVWKEEGDGLIPKNWV
ncbi:DUF3732 domain-containing protein [Burkholderia multivorans]|uniref:DUF3732 domain-containing protein n=1 Tax=Burkholderia multivorans TaxID=87883 RepID=UPI001BA1BFF2|nr:DUF3732 domain-containing protein [Burkholderia multivorans]MBR8123439.1 DUF3732 domain-containing protein [Burkholderia multivorans]MBU9600916.1 DUF3732 domain-containing protein [Burkholderia multivorans]